MLAAVRTVITGWSCCANKMCMRKSIINIFLAAVFLLSLPCVWGFSPAGPIGNKGDSWQTITIGYGYNDSVAPKNILEEYRPVVPVEYYASDASYISYFGSAGLTNIDAAFGILNGVMCGLTNTPVFLFSPTNGVTMAANGYPGGTALTLTSSNGLDSYSPSLSEFPPISEQWNYTAQSLGLFDIKSYVLHEVVGELGLADPSRYVWTLHDRLPNPLGLKNPKCPGDVEYYVVQRNFDVTQDNFYSSYINGALYYFQIIENCGNHPPPYTAITEPYPADPFSYAYTAVATGGLLGGGLGTGGFYTGVTEDDAMGLKYLLSTNNINWEATAPSGGVLLQTNVAQPQTLGTLPISLLFSQAATNDPNTLLAEYPGLTFLSVTTNILAQVSTNTSAFFTNLAGPYTNTGPVFTNWSPVQYDRNLQLLTGQPIGPLLTVAPYTDPATLQTLYPGLLATPYSTNFHVVQIVTNAFNYFTNLAGPYTNVVPFTNYTSVYTNGVNVITNSYGASVYQSNGIVLFTNWSPVQYTFVPVKLTTYPLAPFLNQIPFTDPATLATLYPGLAIASYTSNYLQVQITTNVVPYITNQTVLPIFSPIPSNGLAQATVLTNIYYFTNQPGPTVINYDVTQPYTQISTLDLGVFSDLSKTNPPATMQALYPALQILRATTSPAFTTNINYISYLTNITGAPYSSPPKLYVKAVSTNYLWVTNWHYTFGNVFTNHYYTNRTLTLTSIWITNQIGAPYGSPFIAKTNSVTYQTNLVSGDFFLIPTNWCGFDLQLAFPLSNPPYTYGSTNVIVYSGYNHNGPTGTNNVVGGTSYGLTQIVYDRYTNYNYAVYPGICEPTLVIGTNYTTNIVTGYQYDFVNVITNHIYTNTAVTVLTTNVSYVPGGSPDLLQTNISSLAGYTNLVSGDFYIVPTNWCGYQIVNLLADPVLTTNVITGTNTTGVSGSNSFVQVVVSANTNYIYSVRPGVCEPAVAAAATYTTNIVTQYQYDFLNVITNHYNTSNYVTLVVTNYAVWTNAIVGTITNIVTTNSYWTNQITGDFYTVPTNWCGYQLIGLLTNGVVATNTVGATNPAGVVLLPGQQYVDTTYSVGTNYIYSLRPGYCEPAVASAATYTTNIVTQYQYDFLNVITNHYNTSNYLTLILTNFAVWTNGLVGTITNIVTTNSYWTNQITGDFYTVPTNWCGYQLIGLVTNGLVATNTVGATNPAGVVLLPGQQYVGTTYSVGTNYIYSLRPGYCEPALYFATNYTTNVAPRYSYYFGSIVTNSYYTNSPVVVLTTNLAILTNGLVGTLTNIVTTNITYTGVSGDFYIPNPAWCAYSVLSTQLQTTVYFTNTFSATNLPGVVGLGQQFKQYTVSDYTNNILVVQPSLCSQGTPVTNLRQGVGRVQFIRANYDSLLGQFFQALTNTYTMTVISNGQPVVEYYQRVVTKPDFLFQAADLTTPPNYPDSTVTTPNFDQSAIQGGLAGPGAIIPGTTIVFNENENNLYLNGSQNLYGYSTNNLLNQDTQSSVGAWGSFDASTNYPVVYPSGTSIANLMNQLVIQVTPSAMPDGTNGVAYSVTFTATGGQPPYTWAAPNFSTLVPGLVFSPNTATVSGTPIGAGTFNFTLQLTDSANRLVNFNYPITIH